MPVFVTDDRYFSAGRHRVVFLLRGPIYLVCIAATNEPMPYIRRQLELMYDATAQLVEGLANDC